MAYNFTQSKQVGRWLTEFDPVAKYGYFENEITGTSGGLWFDTCPDGLTLIDYDGVFELPTEVVMAVRDMGLIVEEEME